MAVRVHPIYNNFTVGEITPRLWGAVTWEQYLRACKTLENMLIQPQGGATGRPGLRYVNAVKYPDLPTRCISFRASNSVNYVVEFGHLYCRFYRNGARVAVAGVPVEVVSPYTSDQLFDVHYRQSGDTIVLTHPSHPPQRLSRYSDTSWRLGPLVFDPPPSTEVGARTTATVGGTLTPIDASGSNVQFDTSAAIFLAADVNREILVTSNGSRAAITVVNSATQVHADILDDFPSVDVVPAGSWKLDGSPLATCTPSAASPLGATVTLTLSVAGWRASDLGKYVLMSEGLLQITSVTSTLEVQAIIIIELSGVVPQPPTAWSLEEASWSADNGYPATLGFPEGRLAFANSSSAPDAIWMSASYAFLHFGLGSTADAAISIRIGSGDQAGIRWLSPRRRFLVGTASEEYVLSTPSEAPMTGTNIKPVPSTPHGSTTIMPILAEHATIFVTGNGRLLRELAYAYEVDDYRAPDLLSRAEHLTELYTIVDTAYQRPPDSHVWCVRSDGTLLALTYLRQDDIVGWHRHVTDGLFESVTTIPSADGTTEEVWVVVQRTIGGIVTRYLEWFDAHATIHSDTVRGLRTDSAVTYDGAATVTVTGLDHLEGKTVQIVGDGAVYPNAIVAGGQVTLAGPAAAAIEVGLGYTRTLEPVPPEVASEGTSMGRQKSWGNVAVKLKDTIGCTINGETIPWRAAGDPMGVANTLFSGIKRATQLGWDTEGQVTITQTQPLPITVLAVTGTIAVGD